MNPYFSIGVIGVCGRMGRRVAEATLRHPGCRLSGGVDRPEAEGFGCDLGALAAMEPQGCKADADLDRLIEASDALIDFSTPETAATVADRAAEARCIHIIGVTGFDAAQEASIARAARKTTIVKSGNMSPGVALMCFLARRAAAVLGDAFDVEIGERHHRDKVDAPSGTALMIGEAVAAGRGVDLDKAGVFVRRGRTGKRRRGDIGFATMRGGSVVGEHEAIFFGDEESLTIGHRAFDRAVFARGALTAALWARAKPPGKYDMADILGLGEIA